MLDNGYLTIDGKRFTPSNFDYEIVAEEEVNKSEAGTELVNIIRLDKHVFRALWEGITADMVDELEEMCMRPTVIVTLRGKEYICRARGINPELLKKAYKYRYSDGLWRATVTFTEL